MTTWTNWRLHFERNATRPLPRGPFTQGGLDDRQRATLGRSLAKFQLGESGEGRIAKDIDHTVLPGLDDDYRRALKLFVKEEGGHARVLSLCVQALGGTLLRANWTEKLFVKARRLAGVRLKLVVLLAAEVIGLSYYGRLSKELADGDVKRALASLCADEDDHLAFHAAFFASQTPTLLKRLLFRVIWWFVGGAAGAAVLVDHRETLAAFGVSKWEMAKSFAGYLAEADAQVCRPSRARAAPVVAAVA